VIYSALVVNVLTELWTSSAMKRGGGVERFFIAPTATHHLHQFNITPFLSLLINIIT